MEERKVIGGSDGYCHTVLYGGYANCFLV